MKALSSFLTALSLPFTALVFFIFASSLLVENQRIFATCRLNGASAEECMLKIHGR
jgi:hypothetical protein